MFNDGRLKLFLKQGKKFAANARPRSRGIEVRSIFAPFLLLSAKISSQFSPANTQQWPNHGASDRMDSAESGQPRSAQDMRKHGFRLVVSRVRNCNVRERARFHERVKIIVTRPPRRVLQIGPFLFCFLRNMNRSGVNLQTMLCRQLGYE